MKITPSQIYKSEYMYWARTRPKVKYDLANSGLINYPLDKLKIKFENLQLTGNSEYGYKPLLEQISKHYNVPTENIYTTLGASFANYIVMALLFDTGAEILIEHPTYELFISAARHIGYKIKRFQRSPKDNFKINITDLKKNISKKTKLIFITNLHNPSSAFTEHPMLKEIGEIAKHFGTYVCVDEVYLDSAFNLHPKSSINLGKNFIVTNSLTKVYGLSGLRCGWVLGDPNLIKKMWYLTDLFYVKHAHIAEQISVAAFSKIDKIRKWSSSIITENQKSLNKFIKSRQDLEIFNPGFGTVVFSHLKSGKVDNLYNLLKNKYDTIITPGKYFGMPDYFRIGLGCQPKMFRTGLKNISDALDSLS